MAAAIGPPPGVPRLIVAVLLGAMAAGAAAGVAEGLSRPGRLEPGESSMGHVAWRATSATIAAAACGAVAAPFFRPLTGDGATLAVFLPMFAALHGFRREGFLLELAGFALLMGPLCGVLYRINLDYQTRRDRRSADRRERC